MTVILGEPSRSGAGLPQPLASVVSSLTVASSAGEVRVTGGDPWFLLADPSGLTGPEFDIDTATSPAFDGSVLRSDRPILGDLAVFLPLSCHASSSTQAEAYVADLRRVTRWDATDLRLIGRRADGSTRTLSVRRVQSGGDQWHPRSWQHWYRVVPLRLRALDPYWSGNPRSIRWGVASGAGLLPFLLPSLLASSSVLGNANPLDVGGEVDTYPTWTLTGPMDAATVERGDGQKWTLTEPLLAGESLVVKTDPRERERVQHSVHGNWWEHITGASQLFPLRAGVLESVKVTATNATSGAELRADWSPRFEALL